MKSKYERIFLAACSSLALAGLSALPAQALSVGVSLGGISADVGVGGGGVSASASIGGSGDTSGGGGTSGGGSSSGGGGTSGGGDTSGSGSGGTSGGGTGGDVANGNGSYAEQSGGKLASGSNAAALAKAHAYVGSTLISSDGQSLGMVQDAQPRQGGRYSVKLMLNPALGFGQREVMLLLSPSGKPSGFTRIGMTENQFRSAIAPQVSG
ncbi:hypothetical protein [Thioclava sp. DLFJ4-1]|uniref:hypothetical protein n=1 Tax=Thioclava sp. DLFJ4-1 TaxID=1915313 RepID=UPI0009960B96|nr:hypothetical protein [Thioclava sp. DLFJ4-1]OOY16749.1 hypothetical protein BMI85_06715 [Thioclava sp. DLFJ4-1]